MKRNLCLVFAILMLLATLTACSPKSELTAALWYTKGSIIGLEDGTGYYDVHLTFNEDNTGHLEYIYDDSSFLECAQFEYSAFNGYITFISYEEKVLDKGKHTYPYSIENDVLTIEVDNKKMEFDKLKFTATENQTQNTYKVLQDEYDRITKHLQLTYSGDMITNIYIDHSESVIVVGLKELTDENIKFFKDNISDADFIEFVEASGVNVFTTE